MSQKVWTLDPHSGGQKIPPQLRQEVTERVERHAATHYAGLYTRLDIRFRGALCYIDAFTEPDPPDEKLLEAWGETREQFMERVRAIPTHLCRLRYLGGKNWSLAFYKYSDEKYAPCLFRNGTFYGTPEEGFDVGAGYLR